MSEPIYFRISYAAGNRAQSTLNELVEDVRLTRESGERMSVAFKHAMIAAFVAGIEYQMDSPMVRPIDWDQIIARLELGRPVPLNEGDHDVRER